MNAISTRKTTYTTTIWGQTFSLRADWAQAADQIECLTDEGWEPINRQVADYHGPEAAMRDHLTDVALSGGDVTDSETAAIERAVAELHEED